MCKPKETSLAQLPTSDIQGLGSLSCAALANSRVKATSKFWFQTLLCNLSLPFPRISKQGIFKARVPSNHLLHSQGFQAKTPGSSGGRAANEYLMRAARPRIQLEAHFILEEDIGTAISKQPKMKPPYPTQGLPAL